MLIGKSYHTLDPQRRVAIPKNMRGALGAQPILTRGFDGGVFLVPENFWQSLVNNLTHQPFTKKRTRDFMRLLTNDAYQVEPDRLGRITLPSTLAAAYGLAREVVIIGSLQYIEIWDRDRYHQYLDSIADQATEIAESVDWGDDYARVSHA